MKVGAREYVQCTEFSVTGVVLESQNSGWNFRHTIPLLTGLVEDTYVEKIGTSVWCLCDFRKKKKMTLLKKKIENRIQVPLYTFKQNTHLHTVPVNSMSNKRVRP